jgi:Tfp pilus assembly protein PilW
VGIWRDQRGFFTLVELLTACAVLLLVLASVVTVQRGAMQAYVTGSHKIEVQQNARAALERMGREIRQSAGALTAATGTSLTFVDQATGSTTYFLDATTLKRRANGVNEPIIGNVTSIAFAYWDGNSPPNPLGVPVGTPASVRRLDITIQTGSEDNVVPGGVADTKAALTTSVRLRNLS